MYPVLGYPDFNPSAEPFILDTDFSIPDTGITVVFGPSGSGKTSLLRAIAGLERSDRGFLKIGNSIWQDGDNFVPPHQRSVGYVFQDASLFDHLNVQGNLDYGIKRSSGTEKDFIEYFENNFKGLRTDFKTFSSKWM